MDLTQEELLEKRQQCRQINHAQDCEHCEGLCASQSPILMGIPEEERRQLVSSSLYVKHRKDSYLFREGDRADRIWIICEGQVKLSHFDADGWERVVGIFSEKEAIWEGVFLDGSKYPYSAVCMTKVVACCIDIQDFQKVLSASNVYMNIIVMLSKKLHDANARNMLLSTKDPKSRIAGMLLYYRKRFAGEYIELKLEDMAASLNLRMETVSRKLRELEKEDLIERAGKGKIKIIDYKGLKMIYDAK